jgi:hypothetical protein
MGGGPRDAFQDVCAHSKAIDPKTQRLDVVVSTGLPTTTATLHLPYTIPIPAMASDLSTPEWVQRLQGPPNAVTKAKPSGIPDPPGYTSAKASSLSLSLYLRVC